MGDICSNNIQMERLSKSESSQENTYTFALTHPNTSCPMAGDVITQSIQALTLHEAQVLMENTPVLCSNCGVNYVFR